MKKLIFFTLVMALITSCGTAAVKPSTDDILVSSGFVHRSELDGVDTCRVEGCKVYESKSDGINAWVYSDSNSLGLFISSGGQYNSASQGKTITQVITQLFGKGVNAWIIDHPATSVQQEGMVDGFSIAIVSVDILGMTMIVIAPEQKSTQLPILIPQHSPTFAPTPTPEIGFARSRPAPLGDSIIAGDEAIQVTNVIAPADHLVDSMSAQMFPLAANQEYVAVEISISCNKTQDETCMGVDFSYSIVGSSGQVHDNTVIQVLNECIQCDTVYGGATLKGYVVFIVDKSETNLILVAEKYPSFTVYLLIKP